MILVPLLAVYGGAVLLMYLGVRKAPVGTEDSHGFHTVWTNRSPEAENAFEIWTTAGASASK